jgi:hypothetical protein
MPDKKKKKPDRNREKSTRKGNASTKRSRMRLKVGEPWNECLRYSRDRSSLLKDRIAGFLAIAFVVLLFTLTAYGMDTNDKAILADVIMIDKAGLFLVAVWATGKMLSGWKGYN